ncbi:hypothetical protein GCM10009557_85180 [Virgisporangium ochraceum]|uniref:Uncharacterized protein n=1 Tax=Virgisporangium ochraceum TaxID=65505 RepID=A0A8J3ZT37_9ACTN|nr:hypothetical protein [Virgisporangium ochraceum]GIJ66981.1 hypothetical protein Voc01_018980 [Virgisporangium ochraceum]
MGLYDTRCAITGISLFTADAVMVGLDGSRPVTLGVAGGYNGYGVIENVVEDRNTELIMAYVLDRAREGRMTFHPDYKRDLGAPPRDIESVLAYFERNFCDSSDEYPALALDGRPIVYCMVSKLVWDAVGRAVAAGRATVEDMFADVFGDSPVAAEIYRSALHEVTDQLRDMYAVSSFLRAHGLAWQPPDLDEHGMVYSDEEVAAFVSGARVRFAEVPVVLGALDRHAEEQRRFADD